MKTLAIVFFCSCALAALVSCAAAGPSREGHPATRPFVDRYIEAMAQPESIQKARQVDALLTEFERVVVREPGRSGIAEGIVTDEQGHRLKEVQLQVAWYPPSPQFPKRYKPTAQKTITIDGQFRVEKGGHYELSLLFRKPGYADVQWGFFTGEHSYPHDVQLSWLDSFNVGKVQPRSDGGPGVRIVMYPAHYQWDPPGMSDKLMGMLNRKRDWPAEAPKGMRLIADSSDPRMVAAPETGTYMLTDSEGKILAMERVRRGMRIGFAPTPQGGVAAELGGGGAGSSRDSFKDPRRWYLYSKAKPILPATQPAGAPVAPAPATAPATQVAAPPYVPPVADQRAVETALALENGQRGNVRLIEGIIERWEGLEPAKKEAALRTIAAYRRKTEQLYAKMHAGQPVTAEEAWGVVLPNPLVKQVSDSLADPTLAAYFQWYWGSQTAPPGVMRMAGTERVMEKFLAPLKLDEKQQKQVDQLLEAYQRQSEQWRKEVPKKPKTHEQRMKVERYDGDTVGLSVQTWDKILSLLSPAQRRLLDKNLKAQFAPGNP